MKETIQFIQTSPEDLENRIFNRVKSEIDDLKTTLRPRESTEYITRSQVAELLDVDLSTVHNWTKRGKLKAYGIGNRVYYKRGEVEAAIKPLTA